MKVLNRKYFKNCHENVISPGYYFEIPYQNGFAVGRGSTHLITNRLNYEASGTGIRLHGVTQGEPEQGVLVHVVDVKVPQLSHLYPYL